MKKIILIAGFFCLSVLTSRAQEKTSATASKDTKEKTKSTANSTKPTAKPAAKPTSKKNDAKAPKNAHKSKVSHDEVLRIQKEQLLRDPSHPIPASELEKNGIPASLKSKPSHPAHELRKEGTPDRPLTAAEMAEKNDPSKGMHAQESGMPKEPNKPLRTEGSAEKPLTSTEIQDLQAKGLTPPNIAPVQNEKPKQPEVNQPNNSTDAPKFEFIGGDTYSYGEILESNEPTPHDFEFYNTGKTDLVISEVHGSCGCTVPSFAKEPVKPGKKGTITVKYSSRNHVGPISREVTITSNAAQNPVVLHITGNVKANPDLNNMPPPPPPILPTNK